MRKSEKEFIGLLFPPYIKNFRYLTSRQGFCAEKNDGNYAGLNRKFASRYYSQIEVLIGLRYHELSNPMFEGGINYKLLRDGYFSLSKQNIRKIQNQFGQYDFFLTENTHNLNFETIYKNNKFTLYKLKILMHTTFI